MEPKLMSDAKEDSGLWPGNARACGRAWQKKEKPPSPPKTKSKGGDLLLGRGQVFHGLTRSSASR
jgi:hypothetical protein